MQMSSEDGIKPRDQYFGILGQCIALYVDLRYVNLIEVSKWVLGAAQRGHHYRGPLHRHASIKDLHFLLAIHADIFIMVLIIAISME